MRKGKAENFLKLGATNQGVSVRGLTKIGRYEGEGVANER